VLKIAPDGRVLEVEEQVDIANLPGEGISGLRAQAKAGKITKVESIKKGGTLVLSCLPLSDISPLDMGLNKCAY
jgi:hypothetical protein